MENGNGILVAGNFPHDCGFREDFSGAIFLPNTMLQLDPNCRAISTV